MTVAQAFQIAFAHHQAGRLAEAEAIYRQILAVQPAHAGALHHLGVIALQVGRHDVAAQMLCQAISQAPNNPVAYCNLGEAYVALNRWDEAIAAFRRAIALQPDYPEAYNNLGHTLNCRGELDEAIKAFSRAIDLNPNFPETHYNLGLAFWKRGQLDAAINAYRHALSLRPDYAEAHTNLAVALKDQGRFDEAIEACRRVIALKPDNAAVRNNLGTILQGQGRFDEAVSEYRRALELQPDYAEAHNNLGNCLRDQGRLDEAIAAYRRAINQKPDYAESHNNLGVALKDQGRIEEAIAAYRVALGVNPAFVTAHSNLIFALHAAPASDGRRIAEEQQRWWASFGKPLQNLVRSHGNDRNPDRPLRIGYVSPDFRDHVAGHNVLPLFACADRRNFEIIGYSGVLRPDDFTSEFRRHSTLWRSTVGVSDEAVAEMIRQDGVDILVDLAQHSANNRLPIFTRKPAPVQVSFAGYPESTGLETIGYRLSDAWLEGTGGQAGRRETPSDSSPTGWLWGQPANAGPIGRIDRGIEQVYLLDSFWCYDPHGVIVAVNSLPASELGYVTFGCLSNFSKCNEPMLRLWARVIGAVPDSRLVIQCGEGHHRQWTWQLFQEEGVEAGRIEFVPKCPRRDYLALYHRLDISLDPFPYNGHTTTLDSLWMGVPVVSLTGETCVSRGGLSILSNIGLPELVARSESEYIAIASRLASDPIHLAELRRTLRARMETSVLMDAPHFARSIEAAYRAMWRRWCAETAV